MENRIVVYLFELIRVAIGNQQSLGNTPSQEEWKLIYETAYRQSLLGICFYAISKLPEGMRPKGGLYLEWLCNATLIQSRNEHLDKQTAEIWKQLKEDGQDAVVIKGQGIAMLYGALSDFRQSGDIDIWVKGGYQKVCEFVQRTHPTDDIAYHRFHYDVFKDTEVELHHRPTLMRNLLDDRKLALWYNSFGVDSFIYLEDKGYAVPPYVFNAIFVLTHIYRHFLFEGVGLRQFMDYYFVLKNGRTDSKDFSKDSAEFSEQQEQCELALSFSSCDKKRLKQIKERKEIQKTLQSLRLNKFAGAVMWVLKEQFGLDDNSLICEPDEKEGKFLLNEILLSGNFGQSDKRYQYKSFFKLKRWVPTSGEIQSVASDKISHSQTHDRPMPSASNRQFVYSYSLFIKGR